MEETLRTLGLENFIDVFIRPRIKIKNYISNLKHQQRHTTEFVQQSLTDLQDSLTPLDTFLATPSSSEILFELDNPITETIHKEAADDSYTLKQILSGSLDGRAILKEGQSGGGLLNEGSRRKLSQLVIHYTLERRPSGKITTEEFYKLATEIVELFNKENIVLYYSAYLAGTGEHKKKNASGKLYETYITRRRKLRQSGELPGNSRASSNASSTSTPAATSEENVIAVDNTENLTWLNNNLDPWNTAEKKWADTSDYRLKHIYDVNIIEYFNKCPALRQPQGYILLQNDFGRMYPGKENSLFSTLKLKQEDILAYAQSKAKQRNKILKTEILNLIGSIHL